MDPDTPTTTDLFVYVHRITGRAVYGCGQAVLIQAKTGEVFHEREDGARSYWQEGQIGFAEPFSDLCDPVSCS